MKGQSVKGRSNHLIQLGESMKVKIIVDGEYKCGTVIECDDQTAKEFIEAKSAEVYTEEVAKKDAEVVQDKIDSEVKQIKKESKMTTEVKGDVAEFKGDIQSVKGPVSEWKSMNEFLRAVRDAEVKHVVDPRLIEQKASAGMGEDSNGIGGYLVQHPLWNQEIFAAYIDSAKIAPRCRQFVAEPYANGLKFKQVKETSRQTNWFGGIQFYEVDEGVSVTDSKPDFNQLDVPIKQIGALYYLTQALVDDCPNISSFVAGKVGEAYGQVIDREILSATLGAFTAQLGHLSTVSLPPAGTFPTANELAIMYNSMSAGSLARAEWYMSHKQFGQLMNLVSTPAVTGYGSFPIMTVDAKSAVGYSLFGHPINILEQATATNTAGSIIFADWSNYGIVTKGTLTPQVAMSLHVKFDSNQQTYRFISRAGGAPLNYSKVLLKDGTYVSSVVST